MRYEGEGEEFVLRNSNLEDFLYVATSPPLQVSRLVAVVGVFAAM